MIEWFKYVRISDVARYRDAGWIDLGRLPAHHGAWSHLMQWAGAGEPPGESND